jgi:hypothetical protein
MALLIRDEASTIRYGIVTNVLNLRPYGSPPRRIPDTQTLVRSKDGQAAPGLAALHVGPLRTPEAGNDAIRAPFKGRGVEGLRRSDTTRPDSGITAEGMTMNRFQKRVFAGLVVLGGMGISASTALGQGSWGGIPASPRYSRLLAPNEAVFNFSPRGNPPQPGYLTQSAPRIWRGSPRIWRGSLPSNTGSHPSRDWSTGRDSFLAKPWMQSGR